MDMSYTQDVYMSHGTEYNRRTQHCNVVALYIDGCLGFHDVLVYWNEITPYDFRTSNYVQQQNVHKESCNGSSQLFYSSLQHVMHVHSSGRVM
jgi:hypothetical protein